MNIELSKDTQESFAVSRRVLGNMMGIIDRMIAGAIGHPAAPPGMAERFAGWPAMQRVFPGMLQALGSSSNTLLRLSDEPGLQSRDCFSICRSIVELAVNLCYICAEGEGAAERAEKHAQQKTVRDLNRTSSVGGQEIRLYFRAAGAIDVPEEPKESMAEFTSRSGREKSWSDLSIDARCERKFLVPRY